MRNNFTGKHNVVPGFHAGYYDILSVTKQSKVVRWKDFEEKYSPGLFLVPSALSEKDQCTLECQINEGGVPNKRVGPTTFEN